MEARILAAMKRKPDDGSTPWSTRRLAAKLGVSHMLVHRVWARAGIKPHRIKRYMRSNAPDFEKKAADSDRSLPQSAAARGGVLRG